MAVESSAPAAALIAKTLTALQRNRSWERGMTAGSSGPEPKYVASGAARSASNADAAGGSAKSAAFDVIFIDPPYAFATEDCNQLLSDMVAHGIAGGNTTIVLERSARSDEPVPPEGWVIAEHRDYGETAVWYIESALETSEASETSRRRRMMLDEGAGRRSQPDCCEPEAVLFQSPPCRMLPS